MMRQYELVERVLAYDPKADEALLNRAYVYAMKAHRNQTRASGDPYFSHPLEVAAILTDLKLDDATIATALLHDTIEDTDVTREEIDKQFGSEIGALVDGLTKIKKLDLVTKQAQQAENFRKLLLAISSDIRVLLVKLADRLHNMRTLEHIRPEKRRLISEETLEIYAPLAGRMGMQWLKDELEELAFRWLEPKAHEALIAQLAELRAKNEGLIQEITKTLAEKLASRGIKADVSGREKKPFSIWRKMERKQVSLEQLSDIYAFRVIVGSVEDCYRVIGFAHTRWHIVPGRFKDYISNPKPNGYQSLHTTVIGPRHRRVELQIRTADMHDIAEYGVAAHVFYKDRANGNGAAAAGLGGVGGDTNAYEWLRRLVDQLLEGDNAEEFLEHTKLELFQDQVFCFTPKGRLIALPRGATPIDFAYAVHTDIGNSCTGCRINGHHMPLVTELKNGDEVVIETGPLQAPPAAWEQIARTGKARSAIRRAAREAVRRQWGSLGKQMLSATFARAGRPFNEEVLNNAAARLSQKAPEDIIAAVGRGELDVQTVLKAAWPDAAIAQSAPQMRARKRTPEVKPDDGWFNLTKSLGIKFRWPGDPQTGGASIGAVALPIRGLSGDLPVSFGDGGAVPGDRIVGIMTPGEGIRIYQIHSPKLSAFDDKTDLWMDVTWDVPEGSDERFPATIDVTVLNEPGVLAQVAQVIGDAEGNIDNLRMLERARDFTKMRIALEVWDLNHLSKIIAGLHAKPVVSTVERVFGVEASVNGGPSLTEPLTRAPE
jgi:RelA/SpoT family (p)ppGpp synthetase